MRRERTVEGLFSVLCSKTTVVVVVAGRALISLTPREKTREKEEKSWK